MTAMTTDDPAPLHGSRNLLLMVTTSTVVKKMKQRGVEILRSLHGKSRDGKVVVGGRYLGRNWNVIIPIVCFAAIAVVAATFLHVVNIRYQRRQDFVV